MASRDKTAEKWFSRTWLIIKYYMILSSISILMAEINLFFGFETPWMIPLITGLGAAVTAYIGFEKWLDWKREGNKNEGG